MLLRYAAATLLLSITLSAAGPTTVILVRHAEKLEGSGDVSLSPAGKKRADDLARVVGSANLRAIYVSTLKRTQDTAIPAASKLGLTVARINEPAAILTDIRKRHSGETVLVVHHSNTLPKVASAFGIPEKSVPIAENEFDALFILTDTGTSATVVKLRYGPPSAL